MARFYEAETTEGYMDLLGRYLRKHGRMVALYADRHSSFFARDRHGEAVLTQFGRALGDLDIELIPAGPVGKLAGLGGEASEGLRPSPRADSSLPWPPVPSPSCRATPW